VSCVLCVCVRGSLPPSYIGWRQAVVEGIFLSAPPAPSSSPSILSARARQAKAVPRGAWPRPGCARAWAGPPRAHLHMAASPLLLERYGMVGVGSLRRLRRPRVGVNRPVKI
jgi:hypothetical protein